MTKNSEKTMPKNVHVQSSEAFKLVLLPAGPVTKISKLANMKNFDIIGRASVTNNAKKLIPKNKLAQSHEVLKLASILESLTTSKLMYYYLHHSAVLIQNDI